MAKKSKKNAVNPASVDTTRSAGDLAADMIARITKRTEPVAAAAPKKDAPKVKAKADKPKAEPKAEKPKAEPKPKGQLCECGCGGMTKGGRYLPGHDSKHRAALAGPKEMPTCDCGCGGTTKGGRFLPGHDAKLHSAQLKAKKEAEKAQAQTEAQSKAA
jgi:hypothetical protein